MKRFLFSIILTILTTTFIFTEKISQPTIYCQKPTFNVGKVNSKLKTITHTFTIKNTGDAPLHILKVINTCSCTEHEIPKKEILPGESVKVKITVNISDKFGKFKDGVFLKTDDPKNPQFSLMIEGNVTVDYLIDPPSVDMGRFLQSQYKEQQEVINIKIFSKKIKGIKEIKIDDSYLDFSIKYDKKNSIYTVILFFKEKPPLGYKEGNITVFFNSQPPEKKKISYLYEVIPQVKVEPGGVNLSILKENNPHIFIFYAYYKKPFEILDVTVPEGFSYEIEKIKNKRNLCVYRVKLILENDKLNPEWDKENVVLRTSLEKNPFVIFSIFNK